MPLQQFTPTLAPLENVFLLAKRTRKQSNNSLLRLCCVFLNKRTENWICRSHLWFEATCGVVFLLQLYDLGSLERQPHIWHPLDKLSWDICHMGRSDKHILMELPCVLFWKGNRHGSILVPMISLSVKHLISHQTFSDGILSLSKCSTSTKGYRSWLWFPLCFALFLDVFGISWPAT